MPKYDWVWGAGHYPAAEICCQEGDKAARHRDGWPNRQEHPGRQADNFLVHSAGSIFFFLILQANRADYRRLQHEWKVFAVSLPFICGIARLFMTINCEVIHERLGL